MLLKNKIIDEIIRVEGGFVDDPNDSGGATMHGITEAVARENGYRGAMSDLPRDLTFDIYSVKYWDSVRADDLVVLAEPIAAEVVDTAVNLGSGRASEMLQRALNILNDREGLYPDITVDRNIGPATISALHKYLMVRDVEVFLVVLNCLQGAFYIDLAERREKDESFIYGWFKNRVKL